MASKSRTAAGLAAGVLMLLTWAHAASRPPAEARPSLRDVAFAREAGEVETAGTERCMLFHARFGGSRAQLVRVTRDGIRNYVVMDVGRRDPSLRSLRSRWLTATYGEAEHIWLGDFTSAEAALAAAAQLCPPARRCLPQESGCSRPADSSTSAQIFFSSTGMTGASGM